MSEHPPEAYAKYSHLRANVPKRRTMLWVFFWVVIAVFVISLVDIIWLNEVLQYGVYAAYIILFVWAIILLFSRAIKAAIDRWRVGEVILHCHNCDHAFYYGADHADNKEHASMTCPVCGEESRLPDSNAEVTKVHIDEGSRHDEAYHCGHCEEHFIISTTGKRPRGVTFDRCPHCGETGAVTETRMPEAVERDRLKRFAAS